MNFLRSVIADARPRRSAFDSAERQPAASGDRFQRLDGEAAGAPERFSSRPDPAHGAGPLPLIRQVADAPFEGDARFLPVERPVAEGLAAQTDTAAPEEPQQLTVDRSGTMLAQEHPVHGETGPHPVPQPPLDGSEAHPPPQARAPQPAVPVDSETGAAPLDTRRHPAVERVQPPEKGVEQPKRTSTDDHGQAERADAANTAPPAAGHEWPELAGIKALARVETDVTASSEESAPSEGVVAEQTPPVVEDENTLKTASARIASHPRMEGEAGRHARSATAAPGGSSGNAPAGQRTPATRVSGKVSPPIPSAVDKSLKPSPKAPVAPGLPPAGEAAAAAGSYRGSESAESGQPRRPGTGAPGPAERQEVLPAVPARPFKADSMSRDAAPAPFGPASLPSAKQEMGPKVQIGQIDVIVDAAARSSTKPVQAPSPADLASRYYLRRL